MNTKPFLYGLEKTEVLQAINLKKGTPASIFEQLQNNQLDAGIIPVGALLSLPRYIINTSYCIATDGEVASVCVFTKEPISKVDSLYLDYQSKSSNLLAQIICKFLWKQKFIFLPTTSDTYYTHLKPNQGALIIGDRALSMRSHFNYIYDLGSLWKELTQLPFVFAVWGSKTPIGHAWEAILNKAFTYGVDHIDEVVKAYPYDAYPLDIYYKNNIQYHLSKDKLQAIEVYKKYITQL